MATLPAEYLRALELFNGGEYFACHEVLEDLWRESAGEEREFYHGLIQAAVALYHEQRGNERGARSVYRRARRRLASLPPIFMELPVARLIADLDRYFQVDLPERKPPQLDLSNVISRTIEV